MNCPLSLLKKPLKQEARSDKMAQDFHQKAINEKLYKLFLSEDFGGRNESLPSAIDLIQKLSHEDGDLGWMVAIGTGGNYFCGYLDPEYAKEVYSTINSLVAGSGATTGKAKRVDGGWKVSGNWKYASGCKNATIFTFNALIEGTEEKISVAIDPINVTIHDDWTGLGLAISDTHSVSVMDVFVPDHQSFSGSEPKMIIHPVQNYPFLEFAVLCFIPVVDGILGKMLDHALEIFESRNWDSEKIEALKSEVEDRWEEIRKLTNISWQAHLNNDLDLEENARLMELCLAHNHQCRLVATDLFGMLGMAVLYKEHPINKCFRDLLTASQHSLLKQV